MYIHTHTYTTEPFPQFATLSTIFSKNTYIPTTQMFSEWNIFVFNAIYYCVCAWWIRAEHSFSGMWKRIQNARANKKQQQKQLNAGHAVGKKRDTNDKYVSHAACERTFVSVRRFIIVMFFFCSSSTTTHNVYPYIYMDVYVYNHNFSRRNEKVRKKESRRQRGR